MPHTIVRTALFAIGGSTSVIAGKLYIEVKDDGSQGLKCFVPNDQSIPARCSDGSTTTLNPDSVPGTYTNPTPVDRTLHFASDPLLVLSALVLTVGTGVLWYFKAFIEQTGKRHAGGSN